MKRRQNNINDDCYLRVYMCLREVLVLNNQPEANEVFSSKHFRVTL